MACASKLYTIGVDTANQCHQNDLRIWRAANTPLAMPGAINTHPNLSVRFKPGFGIDVLARVESV